MDIGQALRRERLNLDLTQQQMCEGVLSRSFYAKVESGQYRINAESLFEILLRHQVDITEFLSLIRENYISESVELKINLLIKWIKRLVQKTSMR